MIRLLNTAQQKLQQHLWGETARKTYLAIFDRLLVSGTNFLTLVIIGRICGLNELGIFSLAWTITITVLVIQESFLLAPYTVFQPECTKKPNKQEYAGAILIHQFCIMAFLMTVIFLGACVLTMVVDSAAIINTSWMLLLTIPMFCLREFVRRFSFTHLIVDQVILLDTAVMFLQFFAIGLLFFLGVLSSATTLFAIAIATGLPTLVWFLWNHSRFCLPTQSFVINMAWRHWGYGRWLCAGQLSELSLVYGVSWILAYLMGTKATGLFSACNSIIMVINPLMFGVGNILFPRAARTFHSEGLYELKRLIWKVTGLLTTAVGVICLIMIVLGEQLISTLYSINQLEDVQEIVTLLALASFVNMAGHSTEYGLMVINRPNINFVSTLSGLIATLLSTVALIPSFGVIGSAAGVFIGFMVMTVIRIVAFVFFEENKPQSQA